MPFSKKSPFSYFLFVICYLLFSLLFCCENPLNNIDAPPLDNHPHRVFEREVFELTNIERVKHGLAPFIWHEGAAAVARAHSEDMARKNYFDHNSLDGTTFSERLTRAGVIWRNAAENIAAGYTTPEDVVIGWMNSDGHRKNILGSYTHLGVGYAYDANSGYKTRITQNFITPR